MPEDITRARYRDDRDSQLQYVCKNTHTHTHPFNGPLSGTTRKVKAIWISLKQETVNGSGISWAICKSAPCSRQITTTAPHRSVFTGRMPFLPPNQQRQSTEDVCKNTHNTIKGKGKRTPTDLMSLQAGEANSEQVTLAGTTFGKASGDLPTFRSSRYHFPLQL